MVRASFQETELGIIPKEWGICHLKDAISHLQAGVSVNSNEQLIASDFYVLKTSAVHDTIINLSESKAVVSSEYSRLKCPVRKNSIVISRMNTPELVGECAYCPEDSTTHFLPDRLWLAVQKDDHRFSFRWLNYLLNYDMFRYAIRETATGTSNSMKNIAKERFLDLLIYEVPFAEQEQIAEALDSVDRLISSLEKLIEKKKSIQRGVMQELLTGKKRLPGFTDEWELHSIGEYADCLRGVSYDGHRDVFPVETDDTIRLLRSNNIQASQFVDKDIQFVRKTRASEKQIIQHDDIMVCMANGSRALVGKNCIFDREMNNKYTFGAFMSVVRKKTNAENMHFIYYLMNSDLYWEQIAALFSGSSINNLRPKDIMNMRFLMPGAKERTAISCVLNDISSEIVILEKRLEKYRQLKLGMMQKLLTGEIRLVSEV